MLLVLQACAAHNVPIIPYGSGTSLEGHTIAPEGGISLDFRKMNKLVILHKDGMYTYVDKQIHMLTI